VLFGDWIDVYENPGKRSGAYSAPVYGVHPYMLLNYNDTLDAVFTLAHEMGHSMHTLLSNAHQPFVYSAYTIFVAEVPSTLSEALFLEFMLDAPPIARAHRAPPARHRRHRRHLLHAGAVRGLRAAGAPARRDGSAGHRRQRSARSTSTCCRRTHGDALDYDELSRVTWARIPHFYSTPYYVYQYATCFASSAQLMHSSRADRSADRAAAIDRYLTLLKSGGSDHPMPLLQRAGVDLSKPETVRAVVDQLDALVTQTRRGDRQSPIAPRGLLTTEACAAARSAKAGITLA
jgi:oligoendopeptidase F